MVAILLTVSVLLIGGGIWERLHHIHPNQPIVIHPNEQIVVNSTTEPFVGPYQINKFWVQIVPIIDTSAQRTAHLAVVSILGLLILLRRPLLRLGTETPHIVVQIVYYGTLILACFAFWWIERREPLFTCDRNLTWLPLVPMTTLVLFYLSHHSCAKRWIGRCSAVICVAAAITAVFPAFTTHPDLSNATGITGPEHDKIIFVQHHFQAIVAQGDRLAVGHQLFSEVRPSYGLLLHTLAAAYQRYVGPLSFGNYVFIIQLLQALSLGLFVWLSYRYSRGRWLYCLAPLALILPFHAYDQPGIFVPNQSAWRFIGIPIALATMYTTRNVRPLPSALISGAVSVLCLLLNFEVGIIMTIGLVSFLAFRQRVFESFDVVFSIRLALQFAVGGVGVLGLFVVFFRFALGNFPDLARVSELAAVIRLISSSGLGGVPLSLLAWPMLIFAHSFYVVVQACTQRGLSRFRPAFRASLGIMTCLWFGYFVNRPQIWNLWSYYLFYGFLIIDLLRFIDLQLIVRKRLSALLVVAAIIWTAVIFPVIQFHDFRNLLFATRPAPRGPLLSGVYFPAQEVADIQQKAQFLREQTRHHRKLVYLTPHSVIIPKLAGVYSSSGVADLAVQSITRDEYQECVRRLMATEDVIFLDAQATTKEGWGFGGLFQLLCNDLKEEFTLIGVEQGWEVWQRNR